MMENIKGKAGDLLEKGKEQLQPKLE